MRAVCTPLPTSWGRSGPGYEANINRAKGMHYNHDYSENHNAYTAPMHQLGVLHFSAFHYYCTHQIACECDQQTLPLALHRIKNTHNYIYSLAMHNKLYCENKTINF